MSCCWHTHIDTFWSSLPLKRKNLGQPVQMGVWVREGMAREHGEKWEREGTSTHTHTGSCCRQRSSLTFNICTPAVVVVAAVCGENSLCSQDVFSAHSAESKVQMRLQTKPPSHLVCTLNPLYKKPTKKCINYAQREAAKTTTETKVAGRWRRRRLSITVFLPIYKAWPAFLHLHTPTHTHTHTCGTDMRTA